MPRRSLDVRKKERREKGEREREKREREREKREREEKRKEEMLIFILSGSMASANAQAHSDVHERFSQEREGILR
jgi:hypothetical protein